MTDRPRIKWDAVRDGRGRFVVVLGPDGAGKSTLLVATSSVLARAFDGVWSFHWRPGLLRRLRSNRFTAEANRAGAMPPKEAAYGTLLSLARYSYYLLDFLFGYWIRVRPKLKRGVLVLGERWYYDVVVSPQRYGFRLPGWLLRLGGMVVPSPDLVVILAAHPALIHARKPELSTEEIASQIAALRAVVPDDVPAVEIDTSGALEYAEKKFVDAILPIAADRATSRRAVNGDWRAFPSQRNPKIWIGLADTLANALNMYHGDSVLGRFAKFFGSVTPNRAWARAVSPTKDPSVVARLEWLSRLARGSVGYDCEDAVVSIHSGTPGPHRKYTAQVSSNERVIAYSKIAETDVTRALLDAERQALTCFSSLPLAHAQVPALLHWADEGGCAVLSTKAPPAFPRRRELAPNADDAAFLTELAAIAPTTSDIRQVYEAIGFDPASPSALTSEPGTTSLVQRTVEAIESAFDGRRVLVGWGHGDYAPWNTFKLSDGSLYVFDWEYASPRVPVLNDLYHRVFMPARLVRKTPPVEVVRELLALRQHPLLGKVFSRTDVEPAWDATYLLLYFLTLACREGQSPEGVSGYLRDCIREALAASGFEKRRRRVLVSAYACEPGVGSEPGVGWHWVQQIAKRNNTWVITRANNRGAIEEALSQRSNPNLHFEYVDLPRWLSFWKRKQRGVRTYYYLWQYWALGRAWRLHRSIRFDLAHHVTFVNDWMGTFLSLLPVPMIWGPIGSHPRAPRQLLPQGVSRLREQFRGLIQRVMRFVDPLYWCSLVRARKIVLIASDLRERRPLRWLGKARTVVAPAIGVEVPTAPGQSRALSADPLLLRVLFVGRFVGFKGPHLAVESFRAFLDAGGRGQLVMVGEGAEEPNLRRQVAELAMDRNVQFRPWASQQELQGEYEKADVFLFPSMEGGGMVVLEAMAAGCPVVCLDFGGPGEFVDDATGIKVPVGTLSEVIEALASALLTLHRDPARRLELGIAARRKSVQEFSWDRKGELCERLYSALVNVKSDSTLASAENFRATKPSPEGRAKLGGAGP